MTTRLPASFNEVEYNGGVSIIAVIKISHPTLRFCRFFSNLCDEAYTGKRGEIRFSFGGLLREDFRCDVKDRPEFRVGVFSKFFGE